MFEYIRKVVEIYLKIIYLKKRCKIYPRSGLIISEKIYLENISEIVLLFISEKVDPKSSEIISENIW